MFGLLLKKKKKRTDVFTKSGVLCFYKRRYIVKDKTVKCF